MADYWKSNAKKYCDFCKCWIADNKPSVDFHEKGKRHKENVALKLKNISRQSAKDHKEKKKLDEDFKKMEKPPEEGFTSLDEQKKLEKEEIQKEAKKKIEEARQKEEQEKMKAEEYRAFIEREKMKKRAKVEEKIETKSSIVMGPAPRGNPYGSWTTIKRRDCKSWEAG
ncbi:WW domain-binding protein 4 [Gryllus bimaculatus]|nr:WW domain-binding protein 4 [Gryllus bimaculatus]